MTTTATADVPVLTLPSVAVRLNLTLWELIGVLNRNPDLAARLFRVGGRRCLMAGDVEAFRLALASPPRPTPAPGVAGPSGG